MTHCFIPLSLLILLSRSTSSIGNVPDTNTSTWRKPHHIQWHLDDYHLTVTWIHFPTDELVQGYYLSLCQMIWSYCAAPDFVHFGKDVRLGRIVGLAPETRYRLKVIAFGEDSHIASDPVMVNTSGLKFLVAKNLTVSKVTSSSALFQWHHEAKNNIHDVHFKLSCSGVRQYTDINKKVRQEKYRFNHLSISTSKRKEFFFAEDLAPNTNYVCSIAAQSGSILSPPSQHIRFTTQSGSPTTPPTPVLTLSHESTFTASVRPTNERYGPISHYLLIAVPVFKPKNAPITAPYVPLVPHEVLLEKAISSEVVTTVTQPLPFIVTTFGPKDLPRNYNFGYEWRSVFKPDTYYSVVLAAFTQTKGSTLYSLSPLSNPVHITGDLIDTWIQAQRPIVKRFSIIVIISICIVILLFTIAFIILFVSHYYQAKRRDTKDDYTYVISHDESSDEEIFNRTKQKNNSAGIPLQHPKASETKPTKTSQTKLPKTSQTKLPEPSTLSEKSPQMTAADWAMENMSRSPAFREMVLKNPVPTDEMSELMAKIGHKWEESQNETGAHTKPSSEQVYQQKSKNLQGDDSKDAGISYMNPSHTEASEQVHQRKSQSQHSTSGNPEQVYLRKSDSQGNASSYSINEGISHTNPSHTEAPKQVYQLKSESQPGNDSRLKKNNTGHSSSSLSVMS